MKYQISKNSVGLDISVTGLAGKEKQLLEAFKKCQEGRCSCPTQEYQKLDSLQIKQAEGTITLQLKPKEGIHFDQAEIERCLNHTQAQVK